MIQPCFTIKYIVPQLFALAELIIHADEVSLLTLTIGGKKAGVDPRLLRQMAMLLVAYQRAEEKEPL